ncbi:hypothetical protein [Tsukamurella sp. PLM1]|uniref:hypothetical protein n=1 Tax=Tsukamurella sp. PLM1 TaxID=2929795 RepID=UPI00205C87C9|nr:hypothetical protein [Tsukamurella sp. PLM1]BDH58776.1 hypothetical protein MTP03_37150 [Tsukamurella sp. PLM1]
MRTLLSLAAVAVLGVRCLPAMDDRIWSVVVPAGALAYAVVALLRVPARRRRTCAAFSDERAEVDVLGASALAGTVVAVASTALVAVMG